MKINYDVNRVMKAFPNTTRIKRGLPVLAKLVAFVALSLFIGLVAYLGVLAGDFEYNRDQQVKTNQMEE